VIVRPLVAPPGPNDLFDANDPVEVVNWLVGRLCKKVAEPTAKDLAQQAIAEALPGGALPWTKESGLTLAHRLALRVHNIHLGDRRRKGYRTEEDPPDDQAAPTSSPDPESLSVKKDRFDRLDAATAAKFANSPTVQPVLERMMRGDMSTDEEHAQKTGLTAEQVRNARERVRAFVVEWCEQEDRGDALEARA
jgi:DNA-directed RNA polymerase specialized sigma24 family protein